jgi:hypothetical protein
MEVTDPLQYKHLDLDGYDEFTERMQARGFRFVADLAKPTLTHVPQSVFLPVLIRVMASAEGHVQAAHWQGKARLANQLRVLARGILNLRPIVLLGGFARAMRMRRCIDIETDLDNGVFICTSNAELAATVNGPPTILRRFHRSGTPVEVLLDDHLLRLKEYLHDHPGVRPLPLQTVEQVKESADRQDEAKRAWMESIGWITKEELFHHGRTNPPEVNQGIFDELQKILAEERLAAAQA